MDKNKIRICVAAYWNDPSRINSVYCFLYSILAQTYQNFEIIFHHDGPIENIEILNHIRSISDKITVLDNLERKQTWGHYHRHPTALIDPHADWVVFTNDDNYYVPTFLETMLNTALQNKSEMVYCNTGHNYFNYDILDTYPMSCKIDMGSFMTSMNLVKTTPWESYAADADGQYAELISQKTNAIKAPGVLFIHN
jgi:hypothetical protein